MEKRKSPKLSGSEQVAQFLAELTHPQKAEIEEVRRIILEAQPDLTEQIKWKAPSFCAHGDDRITFNFSGKKGFRLVFHCGVKKRAVPLTERLYEDTFGIMEWADHDRAIVQFPDVNSVKEKKEALIKTVQIWISLTGK